MEYITLNNGIRMPLAGFGTFMLGGEACTDAVAAPIRRISGRILQDCVRSRKRVYTSIHM